MPLHSVPTLFKSGALACAIAFCLLQSAGAQQAGANQAEAAARHGADRPREPKLTLQAAAASEVRQDTVTITLATEIEGASQAAVSKDLTAALDAAMKQAQGAKDAGAVKVRNGAYRIWATTNRDGKVTAWRGRAEILLESKDFPAASSLAGKLADKMPVAGLSFSLSDEARQAEERRLLEQAAAAFRERALAAARAFGFNGYKICTLDLSGSGTVHAPQPRALAMAPASMEFKRADVPLEADTVTVTVSVNGTVALQ